MTVQGKFSLKSISRKEVEELLKQSGRAIYTPFIKEFLAGNHDAVELIVPDGIDYKKPYQAAKAYAKTHKFPFLVRQRQKRIFLLKVKKENPT